MPVVTLQLGQCGNQLGLAWFEALASELGRDAGSYGPSGIDVFFQPLDPSVRSSVARASSRDKAWAARAVMVDMEPKVIRAARQRAAASGGGWCYASDCAAAGQSGSGNNWALGHNTYGPRLLEPVLELVRHQVEACDVHDGFLLLQSMAGGTGAGNEVLHSVCTRMLGVQQPGFADLNAAAARALAGLLLPSKARAADGGSSCTASGSAYASCPTALLTLGGVATHLFSHPSHRVASLRWVPQVPAASLDYTTLTWTALLRRLKAMSLSGSHLEEGLSSYMPGGGSGGVLPRHKYRNRAASALVVLRGTNSASTSASELADPLCYPSWAVDPLLLAAHPARLGGCSLSATVAATDQAAVAPLRPMLARAYAMLGARAYVHQYGSHGLGVADLEACLATVEDTLASYDSLSL